MSAIPDIDLTHSDPLKIGVASTSGRWPDQPGDVVRVVARDLRDLGRQTIAAREFHPEFAVLADINVAIAGDAHTARCELAAAGPSCRRGLVYVGTPTGLAGLVTDIHTLGLADGAVLIPMLPGMAKYICLEVLPKLNPLAAMALEQRTA